MGQYKSARGTATARGVYNLIRTQVADGSLAVGAKVPSTRALAAELGTSRTTVTAAFEQLAAEGYIHTATGRAAVVAAGHSRPKTQASPTSTAPLRRNLLSNFGRHVADLELPPASIVKDSRFIDFLYGAVSSRDFPTLVWRRAYQAELLHQQRRLYYEAPEGDIALRRALQGYLLRTRGVQCDAEQIVVVHGAQQAIDICARVFLDEQTSFVFEDPGYVMARKAFEATGAALKAVQVDDGGLPTATLPRGKNTRLAYVTPSHQFPLGGVLPVGRRQELLQWAREEDAWIIEDDYDGEFRYGQRPIEALQGLDLDGRVVYVGTFSKALSPQLRLGYMVVPHPLVQVMRRAKRLTDRHAPQLEQRVLARLLDSGAYERHVRRVRREHEKRRAVLLEALHKSLPQAEVVGAAAGLHVVVWLPGLASEDEHAVVQAARDRGIGVYPVSALYAASRKVNARPAGLVLGYASLTVDQIERGARALGNAVGKVRSAGA